MHESLLPSQRKAVQVNESKTGTSPETYPIAPLQQQLEGQKGKRKGEATSQYELRGEKVLVQVNVVPTRIVADPVGLAVPLSLLDKGHLPHWSQMMMMMRMMMMMMMKKAHRRLSEMTLLIHP